MALRPAVTRGFAALILLIAAWYLHGVSISQSLADTILSDPAIAAAYGVKL